MSATRKISALTIILNALKKMSPRTWIGNPMLAIVFITACLATILLIQEITFSTGILLVGFPQGWDGSGGFSGVLTASVGTQATAAVTGKAAITALRKIFFNWP